MEDTWMKGREGTGISGWKGHEWKGEKEEGKVDGRVDEMVWERGFEG